MNAFDDDDADGACTAHTLHSCVSLSAARGASALLALRADISCACPPPSRVQSWRSWRLWRRLSVLPQPSVCPLPRLPAPRHGRGPVSCAAALAAEKRAPPAAPAARPHRRR